jgi:adenosylhomocysteine nucleosidase
MRLHRTITPDRPLLVVALEVEAAHLHVSELPVLVTGIGKVNAAIALSTILGEFSPSRIVNLGTAGALKEGLSGTLVVGRVIEHDFDDAALFELTGLHFGEELDLGDHGPTLATGDLFVSDPGTRSQLAARADLVDMEGYAIARAAQTAGVPVTLVKQVSDSADDNAGKSWRQAVDECAEHLGAWVRRNLLG